MTASTSPLRSTRLENLRLEGNCAWLDLEGQPIELTGEAAAPALQSFQAFYQTAYQAYQTQPDRPPIGARTPWWQRLRGWIAQWMGGVRAAAGRILGPEGSPAAPSPAAPMPRTEATASVSSLSAAPSALGTTRPTTEPSASASSLRIPASRQPLGQPERDAQGERQRDGIPASTPAQSSRAPAAPPAAPGSAATGRSSHTPAAAAAPSPVPLLRAAFADEKGVHLIWKNPSGRGAKAETELIYPFNSPVAAGLQACYGQLAEMGHAVVDLAAWQPSAEGVVERDLRARSSVEPRSGPNSVRPQARPEVALHPPAVAAKKAEADSAKTDPGRLMRLNPERSDIASRLVVIPTEGEPKPEVITGAETFFNALHAAADPAVPESERLTFLKCRHVKGELKVVELGFGRQAGAAAEPARTETAAAWWKNAQKIRAAAAKIPDASTTGALPVLRSLGEEGGATRSSTEPGAAHQVELFGG